MYRQVIGHNDLTYTKLHKKKVIYEVFVCTFTITTFFFKKEKKKYSKLIIYIFFFSSSYSNIDSDYPKGLIRKMFFIFSK